MEVLPLELHAVRRLGRAQEAQLGFQMQEDDQVREQSLGRPHVQRQDVLLPEAARRALVRERGVHVSVADHDLAVGEGGPDDRASPSARGWQRTAAPRSARRACRSWDPTGPRGPSLPSRCRPARGSPRRRVPASGGTPRRAGSGCPCRHPSTPSKATKSPVAGGRFSFGTSVSGIGPRESVSLEQPACVEPRSRRQEARGRERQPRPVDVVAEVGVPAIDRRQDREEHQRQEQAEARQRRERREGPTAELVGHVLLQERVTVHPRRAAAHAEQHGDRRRQRERRASRRARAAWRPPPPATRRRRTRAPRSWRSGSSWPCRSPCPGRTR